MSKFKERLDEFNHYCDEFSPKTYREFTDTVNYMHPLFTNDSL